MKGDTEKTGMEWRQI